MAKAVGPVATERLGTVVKLVDKLIMLPERGTVKAMVPMLKLITETSSYLTCKCIAEAPVV